MQSISVLSISVQSITVHHTCTKLICYDDKSLGFQLTQLQSSLTGGEWERSLQCPKEWNACRFQWQWQWCLHNIQRMLHWNNFLHHPGTSWIFSLNKPWYCLILESDNGSNDFIPNPSGPQGCCLSCSGLCIPPCLCFTRPSLVHLSMTHQSCWTM